MTPKSPKEQPLLSILCQGRNDSYMGNFTWRLSTVLNKLAENVVMLGLEERVEILVSDWGSENPLYTVLELTEPARLLVKYLVVPPELAARYDRDAGFSVPHAINSVARRARGRYLMFSDSDVYLPMETMAKLVHYLELGHFHSFDLRNSFFWASKYHIPNDFIADSPYREHVEEHIARHGAGYAYEKVNTEDFMGCGVCLLMSRDMWFGSTGWDERLIYMGWNDIDFTRRLLFKYRFDDLANHGMTFFHLEHYRDRFNPNYAQENKKKLNPYLEPTVIAPNPDDWGLARHPLHFVDGFGVALDPATGLSPSGVLCRFDTGAKPKSVRQIEAENPIYRGIADRFPFEPHSWFTNGEAIEILLQMLKPETVCEIGSWMGASARCFASAPSVKTVVCIDHWDRYRVEKYQPGIHPEHLMNNMYEQFLANAVHAGVADKICPVRLDSDSAAAYCREQGLRFDLIYVDGDHTTVGAKADILRYFPLLTEGGYLCGDDWSWQKEPDNVAGAVVAAAREHDWQVHYHGNFWLAIPGGYSVQPLTIEVLQAIKPVRRAPAAPAAKPAAAAELDNIIAPEIKGDELYRLIVDISAREPIATILEIGSSAGGGSTEAFVTGIAANPAAPRLFCMEVSRPRFEELQKRYADRGFVSCYNTSSVPLSAFPAPAQVESFYGSTSTNLNHYPLERILGWLKQDIDYVAGSGFDRDGIALIKSENGIEQFDMVLIDGSEFTGEAELERVYGARWLLLDDVNAYKNYANYQRLKNDPGYELYRENWSLRNGYAVFRKKDEELPVHFFTIVLNGMPFIRYHAEVLKSLPFKWHWHIVEGVAELVHDTAWSLQLGGKVSDAFHRDGRSIDGTTEYLDELERLFPGQVTLYRKPKGELWQGKLEMVQAPVENLPEQCLLWQVDVDEFWTAEQVKTVRSLFLAHPEKTAAFYWCHFFVGPRLMVGSRNCYSQNPDMEWLRTWRFTKGCRWIAHEPPRLHRFLDGGGSVDLACIDPFRHAETERAGLVFQHFAYVLPEQLSFKETYYGYRGALACWRNLQEQKRFPLRLRDFFPWVCDDTTVVPVEQRGVVPIPLPGSNPARQPVTVVDGVFYQMNHTGIARVWTSLLTQWAGTEFGDSLVVLDRAGTAPRVPGIRYRSVPCYQAGEWDRTMLQAVCDEEGAEAFVSTYYSTPLTTPSLFLAHDMIPEFTDFYDLADAQWQEKHHAINRASAFVAVSQSTARDLARLYPDLENRVAVAHNGIDRDVFSPAPEEEVADFRRRHGLDKPYFVFIGMRQAYKNGLLPLLALQLVPDPEAFTLLYVGGGPVLEPEMKALAGNLDVRVAALSDRDLVCAYSGAEALIYPSTYEGFGLPILEAMACRCPVITCQNSSIPEVAGAAALYVSHSDPRELADAMLQIATPEVRRHLIHLGDRQVAKFSWKKMADTVRELICREFPADGDRGEIETHAAQAAL